MMRRIESEERLAAIRDGAIAAGNMERMDARRHQAKLQRAAAGGQRPKAAKANPAALAAMGIAVVRVPRSASSEQASAPSEKGVSDA